MSETTSLFLPLIFVFAIMYFLVIRPQNQRLKRHRQMIADLKKGDKVVTQGGIFAKVTNVPADGQQVEVEIASGVKVSLLKSTIQTLANAEADPAAKKPAAKKPADKAADKKTAAKKPAPKKPAVKKAANSAKK